MPDTVLQEARNVSIRFDDGRSLNATSRVRITLTFTSKWLSISEVTFTSKALATQFTPATSTVVPLATTRSHAVAVDEDKTINDSTGLEFLFALAPTQAFFTVWRAE